MAENKINKKIEFAYSTQSITAELLLELEKRFLYQKILIIDNKYELSDEIDTLIKKTKCDFLVVKNLCEVDDLENFSCIIDINCFDINTIKTKCTQWNKPYIVVLTKIFEISFLNNEILDENKKLTTCNYPLGVVLLKSKVFNKQDFICKFLLELSNFMFDILQSKIDNLFFNDSKNIFLDPDKVLSKLSIDLNIQKNTEEIFNKIANFYLVLCVKKTNTPLSLLDRITELFFCYETNLKNKIQTRFLLQNVLASLTKSFLLLFTKKYKSTLNINNQKIYLNKYSLNCDFKLSALPEQKIEYLLSEFRSKLVKYADEQLSSIIKIKSIIADINVDFLYQTFNLKFNNKLTDFICLEPNLFNKNSILKMFSYYGLLNFEF